jgi:hypothetical protein
MKPLPPPPVPGNTGAERLDNAVRMTFSASKKACLKEEARLKRATGSEPSRKSPPDLSRNYTSFPDIRMAQFPHRLLTPGRPLVLFKELADTREIRVPFGNRRSFIG